jgi:hypothetical protein
VIHDLGVGIGFWSEGEAGEIYGCLIYNNGWKGPDRGHGHAIYTQNLKGVKRLVDNVLFQQFSHGIHAYGSGKAHLEGFHIEGNASFCNGAASGPEHLAPNILVGGGDGARNITLQNNYTYHPAQSTHVRLGYGAANQDLKLIDNYFAGYTELRLWNQILAQGNTFCGANSLVYLEPPAGVGLADYRWDNNRWRSSMRRYPPVVAVQSKKTLASDWSRWQAAGLDQQGRYDEGSLQGVDVFVRPNRYEPGRGHVIVYNWDRAETVPVDLTNVLMPGQKFRIVPVQDCFGLPVVAATWAGSPVRLPMQARRPSLPKGMPDAPLSPTGPEFDVFLVLPDAESGQP